MKKLSNLFDKFHTAMLDNDAAPVIPSIKANSRITAEKQLAIYLDGYRVRLVGAIRMDYPELANLLGEQFDALAVQFITRNPPSHFNLDRYPHGFAAFVRGHVQDAFAADLATLEGAIAEVFMLPESVPLEPSALAGITPEQFSNLMLKARAASRMLHLYYPVNTYMDAARTSSTPKRPEPQKNHLFLVRHKHEVKRHPLSRAEHALLSRLSKGRSVGEALDAAMTEEPGLAEEISTNLQRWFARWVSEGFFQTGKT